MQIAYVASRIRPGRRRPVLTTLIAVFCATMTAVSSAAADPTSAMQHCITHASPQIEAWVNLGGGSTGATMPAGLNPPNILRNGDVYSVSAGGWVRIDLWGQSWGPSGNGHTAGAGFPFPGYGEYSEILRFNNNPGGWVGEPQQANQLGGCQQWHGLPVRLLFQVNDGGLWDNGGYWSNNIRIWQASAPA
jgi:hypothetical protein